MMTAGTRTMLKPTSTSAPHGGDILAELPVWNRFHVRPTAVYAVAVAVILGVNALVFYFYGVERELEAVQNKLHATAVTLSASIDGEPLKALRGEGAKRDPAYAKVHKQIAGVAAQYPSISSIYLLRATGEEGIFEFAVDYTAGDRDEVPGGRYDARRVPKMLLGATRPSVEHEVVRDRFGVTLSGYAPLRDAEGRPMGVIGVDVDASQIDGIKSRMLTTSLVMLLLTTLLMWLAAWINGRLVRKPLSRVIRASDAVAHGDFRHRLDLKRTDEFGILGEHFNGMARDLEEREVIRETLGRYVSEEVAEAVLSSAETLQLGGEERVVTVLFSDLRGYSTLSECLSPSEIVTLLNAYLGEMNDVIDDHLGCVIEYLGDAIMAVFGAPNDMPDHAERAVACAVAMRRRFEELNAEWEEDGFARLWRDHGIEALSARIGIHTGVVVAGNLGSASRMKYAVIGDTVNVAARLEQLNKPLETDILISGEVFEGLSDELKGRAEDMGAHQVKGRQQEVSVYCVARRRELVDG